MKDKEGGSFHVNLGNKHCSCNVFQTLMIPCSHDISASINGKVRVESLVSEVYSLDSLAAVYKGDIFPVSKINSSQNHESDTVGFKVLPPATRRPPGRPRKSRILSTG